MTAAAPIGHLEPAPAALPERVGVLLVNLGTPDTSDARGVRVYLKEFLSDPRVIENQGLIWKLILNGIILRVRPGRKARDYQKIWNTEKDESPLKTITRSQAEKLAAAIADHKHVVVDWAMRYGNPSMRSRIDALVKGNDIVSEVAKLIDLPPDEVDRINRELAVSRGFQPVSVADNIPYEQYAAITVRLPELPGIAASRGFTRFYPGGSTVGQLIGSSGVMPFVTMKQETSSAATSRTRFSRRRGGRLCRYFVSDSPMICTRHGLMYS